MIYQLASKYRGLSEDVENALLRHDTSTVKLREKEQESTLQELVDYGCQALAFWLRHEHIYAMQAMKYSRGSRIPMEETQRTWNLWENAAGRVNAILGAI